MKARVFAVSFVLASMGTLVAADYNAKIIIISPYSPSNPNPTKLMQIDTKRNLLKNMTIAQFIKTINDALGTNLNILKIDYQPNGTWNIVDLYAKSHADLLGTYLGNEDAPQFYVTIPKGI